MLTNDDLAILDQTTPQRLAEMACLLSMWLWPRELPDPEKPDWNMVKGAPPTNVRRRVLREEIERRIGLRAVLQEWNRRKGNKKRGKRIYSTPVDSALNYIEQ